MENASRAIVIAGGILIGLITISLFYYIFNRVSEFKDITNNDTQQQELLDFNQGYEAYNKKIMYGADVISVLNKAIDNNTRNKVTAGDNSGYSVNVVITLKNNLQAREEYYKSNGDKDGDDKILPGASLKRNIPYSLKSNKTLLENALINAIGGADEEGIMYDNAKGTIRENLNNGRYKLIYYPAAEFKRRVFYCSKIDYDTNTGRVKEMQFQEK